MKHWLSVNWPDLCLAAINVAFAVIVLWWFSPLVGIIARCAR